VFSASTVIGDGALLSDPRQPRLDQPPVAPATTPRELRNRLAKPLNSEGLAPETVIEELVRDAADGVVGSAGAGHRLPDGARHLSGRGATLAAGPGREQIEDLAVDEFDRLLPDALETALQADPQSPAIVLLQAGDINIGAYDCFETLIPIARRFGAWVHADGAFWLWAAASAHYAHLLADANTADSWATDGHKWLYVPYDCGYAFVAHPDAHLRLHVPPRSLPGARRPH
jgi:hypothetical protein